VCHSHADIFLETVSNSLILVLQYISSFGPQIMSGQQTPRNKRKGSPLESQQVRYLSNEGYYARSSSDQPQIRDGNQTARGSSSHFDEPLNQTPGGMMYPHSIPASVSLGLDQAQSDDLDRLFTSPYEYNTKAYGFPLSYNNQRSLSCPPYHSFSPDLHSAVPQTLHGGIVNPYSQQLNGSRTVTPALPLGSEQVQDDTLNRPFTSLYEYNTNDYGFPLSHNTQRSPSHPPDYDFSPDLNSAVPQILHGGIANHNPITPYSQQLHGSRTVTPAHRQQDKSSSYGQDQTAQYLPPNTIPQDVNYTYPNAPAITSVRPKIERLFCQDDTCNFSTGTEASLERHILNEHPGQDPEDWIQQALAIHLVSDAAGIEIFHCFHYLCDMEFKTEYARNLHHKSAHKGSKEAWQCFRTGCGSAFENKDDLATHLVSHDLHHSHHSHHSVQDREHLKEEINNGIRPFQCKRSYCLERFTKRAQVQMHTKDLHMRRHTLLNVLVLRGIAATTTHKAGQIMKHIFCRITWMKIGRSSSTMQDLFMNEQDEYY
jgi:hypothetical protein